MIPDEIRRKRDELAAVACENVYWCDDDELDEHVDPLAQTAVTDVAGLAMDAVGSGSGILDLTRESDDTSLGAELLEEIYTGEETVEETGGTVEMGEDTRAGLDVAAGAKEAVIEEAPPVAKRKAPLLVLGKLDPFPLDVGGSSTPLSWEASASTRTLFSTVHARACFGLSAMNCRLRASCSQRDRFC